MEVLCVVIGVCILIATTYLIAIGTDVLKIHKHKHLVEMVKIAVESAEQLYDEGAGVQKKEYVVAFLLAQGLVFDVDKMTAMIESTVYNLKNKIKF